MLMGLRVARTKVAVYAISGFCAALGGLLLLVLHPVRHTASTRSALELDAIAAVVIGGTLLTGGAGYVLGSLLGVLVLGTIQTFISFDGTLSSYWTRIITGALLLVFVLVQRLADPAEAVTELRRDGHAVADRQAGDGRRRAAGRASRTRPSRG